MLLRPRQEEFVGHCVDALKEKNNTLGVAPTGAGKTVMMAAIAKEAAPKKLPMLVVQHRDELLTQNAKTFRRYIGRQIVPRYINADNKVWNCDADGYNFAMVQTLARNLDDVPKLGLVMIDEAHHIAAPTYRKLINTVLDRNPDCRIYGTTATPNRGDNKALMGVFDNCADQITISELIQSGHLVRPRTFVVDVGVRDGLEKVRRTALDFDMQEVERLMNHQVINEKVVQNWKEKAGDRQTIVFCSTIDHANSVTKTFLDNNIRAVSIDGEMSMPERRRILAEYDQGEHQVLVNVAVLTEGFDSQPTACVVLLRPSSWKSTMVQMIGRGLRKLDPELYPGVQKDDCIVLDFGTAVLTHGALEEDTNLGGSGTKTCPGCQSTVPTQANECPICAYEFPRVETQPGTDGGSTPVPGRDDLQEFVMSEIDILNASPFRYEEFYNGSLRFATAFTSWACVVHGMDGRFYAIGGRKDPETNRHVEAKLLSNSDSHMIALQSADDWMLEWGDKGAARKSKRWLSEMPTDKQLHHLGNAASMDFGLTKYRAACMIEWKWCMNKVRGRVEKAMQRKAA